MLSFLAAPGFQWFSIAGLLLIGLLAVETAGMAFGHSIAGMIDAALHLDSPEADAGFDYDLSHTTASPDWHGGSGWLGTAYDWLNAGRVPLLVLMMSAIGGFAVSGLVIQIVAMHAWAPLPNIVAVPVALAMAVPAMRWTSRLVSRIVPQDETYVLGTGDLIGRTGIVTLGPVAEGVAARAKIQDQYGNWHFPRVRPGRADISIPQGATVLVVDQVHNELAVIPAEGRLA